MPSALAQGAVQTPPTDQTPLQCSLHSSSPRDTLFANQLVCMAKQASIVATSALLYLGFVLHERMDLFHLNCVMVPPGHTQLPSTFLGMQRNAAANGQFWYPSWILRALAADESCVFCFRMGRVVASLLADGSRP